ncbi:hypothetical protein GCM10022276_06440 [Sphingomonas limnosediminicola]|uniref:Uncharacterized protein n=1 Tax=Sphingomonas limnosediminicola TaxID=940133 RepID=A0ABP7KYE4_9SPHN
MTDAQTSEAPRDASEGSPALKGSLLLFIVWLGLVGPVYSVALNGFFAVRWAAMYPEAGSYYVTWHFWWFVAAREASRIIAALALVRRSAAAVWFTILVLWVSGPALVTGTWLLSGPVIMPGALVRSTAIAAAATLYLLRSGRVRTVYRLRAEPDRSNATSPPSPAALGYGPATIDSRRWTGDFSPPRNPLAPWRLRIGIGLFGLILVYAPIAIFDGFRNRAILVPLCKYGACTVQIERHGAFVLCIAVWLILAAVSALLIVGFWRLLHRDRPA